MSLPCMFGNHKWDGCKCSSCGKTRDQDHEWLGCRCLKCSQTRELTPLVKAPFPRILLAGEEPYPERLSLVFPNIALKCGFRIKDMESPSWDQEKSLKCIKTQFKNVTNDEMERIAREIWGQDCLQQPSCIVTILKLEYMSCLMLIIGQEESTTVTKTDNSGYLPNFFPRFGGCRIKFSLHDERIQKARAVVSQYQASFSLRHDPECLNFEIRFASAKEMHKFMEELLATMPDYRKTVSSSWLWNWKQCKHGRYYDNGWGSDMTACIECIESGEKPWMPKAK